MKISEIGKEKAPGEGGIPPELLPPSTPAMLAISADNIGDMIVGGMMSGDGAGAMVIAIRSGTGSCLT